MGKRINIVRVKAEWTPTLEWANAVIANGTKGTHGLTITRVGRISMTADIEFGGGDIEDFNGAHLSAANLMADIEANGEVHSSSIEVTSSAGPLPIYTVGDDADEETTSGGD